MEQINVNEDLAFIKRVMEETKQCFLHDGRPFIVWGMIVIIGQIFTYVAVVNHIYKYVMYMWAILALIGWSSSYLDFSRRKQKIKAETITGKVINAVWISCGIAIMILVFLAPAYGVYNDVYINPVVSSLLGIANFTTGSITYKWLRYVAVGWWCGAIVMFIYPGLYTLLLMAAILFVFQVIPGLIINYQWRKGTALAE